MSRPTANEISRLCVKHMIARLCDNEQRLGRGEAGVMSLPRHLIEELHRRIVNQRRKRLKTEAASDRWKREALAWRQLHAHHCTRLTSTWTDAEWAELKRLQDQLEAAQDANRMSEVRP